MNKLIHSEFVSPLEDSTSLKFLIAFMGFAVLLDEDIGKSN